MKNAQSEIKLENEMFENVTGKNFNDASDSDYDTTLANIQEKAELLCISNEEKAKLKAAGFDDLLSRLNDLDEALGAHEASKRI